MAKGSKKEVMFERMQEQKKEVKVVRKIVFWIAIALILVVAVGGFFTYRYIKSALEPIEAESEKTVQIEVPIGSGLDTISQILEEKGLIKNAKIFKYYAKVNNESDFQAGTYDLSKSMTPDELLKSLKTGKVYRTPVFTMTIPEGLTVEQIAERVAAKTTVTKEEFLTYIDADDTIVNLQAVYPEIITDEVKNENIRHPLEGYLFPATYSFYEEEPTVQTVVETLIDGTKANVTPYLAALEEKKKSVHWLLTFASLLEREATAQADRQTIASVFNNRIEEGMPLQTDPTVLYSLGEHKDKVSLKDLEVKNAYNTYQNKGLPPGPIAAPGAASIEAVIDPSDTSYFYFLADKTGKNHFAKTYDEHLKLKAKYIDGK
ncbi:endolytic transglycosylase MltG [Sporosarcina gallistercoris]|uniref:Endolytic murein transglycosylase n=1 Tax=Sporosarcina gallistercoris TaxID=2762245 RepID=A0ABR8PFG0_9BACL|nr:endolytic transglycosylase MltG [Sporosarcina gallistercoris]MBD7906897.1 endolytic transglycosylase MltG [Sporosarcina gallistercoris]